MSKFKEGDILHIIGNCNGHRFEFGDKVKIDGVYQQGIVPIYTTRCHQGMSWHLSEKDLIKPPIIHKQHEQST